MRDVFSGSQDYRTLKRRVWNQFGITLLQFTRSILNPRALMPAPRPRREPLR